jgi:hypothetical protein
MRSDAKRAFYFNTDANSLGGAIDAPFQQTIPSQASASLPAVGGHITHRTDAFNFQEIISCRAAYTRVSGRAIDPTDGPWSAVLTSVVEGLNILDIVTADRMVAQLSVEYSAGELYPRVSLAGSHFDHLKIGGCDAYPQLNSSLLIPACTSDSSQSSLTFPDFQRTGRQQAGTLLSSTLGEEKRVVPAWIIERYGWMTSDQDSVQNDFVLCSLVDSVDRAIPACSFGHVIEVPDFGRIFLGELLVSPRSVRISMVRADLGCNVSGAVSAASGGVGGRTVPP